MDELYTQSEFESCKYRETLPLSCLECGQRFHCTKDKIIRAIKNGKKRKFCSLKCCSTHAGRHNNKHTTKVCEECSLEFQKSESSTKRSTKHFCSKNCRDSFRGKGAELVCCKQCKKEFKKYHSEIIKHPNHFCCRSCAATYNNTHKSFGTRRSKLEHWIETELISKYPDFKFEFNNKSKIGSELDIFLPSLLLAFELNGIYHYEPIHGENKFSRIKHNDQLKFKLCIENNIELCVIDTSGLKYFKPNKAQKYLDIITAIINEKASA